MGVGIATPGLYAYTNNREDIVTKVVAAHQGLTRMDVEKGFLLAGHGADYKKNATHGIGVVELDRFTREARLVIDALSNLT